MSKKHTPGPWKVFHWVSNSGDKTGVTSDKFDDIAHCSGFNSNRTRDEELANARLIAASPELLEALKSTTASLVAAHSLLTNGGKNAMGSDKMFFIMLDDFEKAIEKARSLLKEID